MPFCNKCTFTFTLGTWCSRFLTLPANWSLLGPHMSRVAHQLLTTTVFCFLPCLRTLEYSAIIWAPILLFEPHCYRKFPFVSAISGRVMLNMETFGGTKIRFMWFSPQHPTAQHTGNNSGRQLGWRCRAELDGNYVTQLDLRNCSLFIPFCLLLRGLFNYKSCNLKRRVWACPVCVCVFNLTMCAKWLIHWDQ